MTFAHAASGALAARREIPLQVLDVGADRGGRFGRRIRQIAEQVQIAKIAERARQILVDEAQRPAHALEPDLDVDAGGIFDVVARRLNEPRHLAQLRKHAARALGQRRVVEDRLAGQARREDVGVELRAALPRAHLFQLEQPRAQACVERGTLQPFERALDALHRRQAGRVDRRKPARESSEIAHLRVNRLAAQILEQIVVEVDAVERGVGRVNLVEIRQVLVDKVRKRFG